MTIQNAFRKICKYIVNGIWIFGSILIFSFGLGAYSGFFVASMKVGWDVGQEICYKILVYFMV